MRSTFAEDPDGDQFSIKYGSGSVDGKVSSVNSAAQPLNCFCSQVVIDNMLIGGIKLPEAR